MQFFLEKDIEEIIKFLEKEIYIFEDKRILITGGQGFLGRYFSQVFMYLNKSFLKKKINIVVLDNLKTAGTLGELKLNNPNFEFYNHNVIEDFKYEKKIDFIIHAAGIASPYYYRKWPLETLEVATIGLKNSLNLAKKNNAKLIFFSSSEIYGDPDPSNVPTLESYNGNVSCLGDRASYDESKRLGETLVKIFSEQYGVKASIIRPFNVYRPGMQKLDYRVLPNFASKIVVGSNLSVYGNGNQTRTFCYITDAITGFLKVLLSGLNGEPYNIGNPNPEISMLELIEKIKQLYPDKAIDYKIIKHPDTYPADEPQRRCPNIDKAKIHLNYNPQIKIDEGLSRFMNWALEAYNDN